MNRLPQWRSRHRSARRSHHALEDVPPFRRCSATGPDPGPPTASPSAVARAGPCPLTSLRSVILRRQGHIPIPHLPRGDRSIGRTSIPCLASDTRSRSRCRPEPSRCSIGCAQMLRQIFDINRSCKLPELVDRIVPPVETPRPLDRLRLRHSRKVRHESCDGCVIEIEGRSHDRSMPYNLADPSGGRWVTQYEPSADAPLTSLRPAIAQRSCRSARGDPFRTSPWVSPKRL